MEWQTIKEWEEEHKKDYPLWCSVYHYDGYGECWEAGEWREVKEYYIERRKETKKERENNACWDFQYEPMVCLPTDKKFPRWGDGKRLKYNFED